MSLLEIRRLTGYRIGAILKIKFLAYKCLLLKFLNKLHLLTSDIQLFCTWAGPASLFANRLGFVSGPLHSYVKVSCRLDHDTHEQVTWRTV